MLNARWLDNESLLVRGFWGVGAGELREIDATSGALRQSSPPMIFADTHDAWTMDVGEPGRLLAYDVVVKQGDLWLVELTGNRTWKGP